MEPRHEATRVELTLLFLDGSTETGWCALNGDWDDINREVPGAHVTALQYQIKRTVERMLRQHERNNT